MPVTVLSPFSGRPVKVRDQDIGRAVRDEENRIFYVLPKSDGKGYYGAATRAGGPKDEARALEMENKQAVARGNVHEQVESLHDATGRRGGNGLRGKLVVLLLAVIVLTLAWLVKFSPWKDHFVWQVSPAPPSQIIEGGPRNAGTPGTPGIPSEPGRPGPGSPQ
jgi:hypothetical protein